MQCSWDCSGIPWTAQDILCSPGLLRDIFCSSASLHWMCFGVLWRPPVHESGPCTNASLQGCIPATTQGAGSQPEAAATQGAGSQPEAAATQGAGSQPDAVAATAAAAEAAAETAAATAAAAEAAAAEAASHTHLTFRRWWESWRKPGLDAQ